MHSALAGEVRCDVCSHMDHFGHPEGDSEGSGISVKPRRGMAPEPIHDFGSLNFPPC